MYLLEDPMFLLSFSLLHFPLPWYCRPPGNAEEHHPMGTLSWGSHHTLDTSEPTHVGSYKRSLVLLCTRYAEPLPLQYLIFTFGSGSQGPDIQHLSINPHPYLISSLWNIQYLRLRGRETELMIMYTYWVVTAY